MSLRRVLHQSELVDFESLLSLLSNVFVFMDVPDSRIGKLDSLRFFSFKFFLWELEPVVRPSCAFVWMGLAPPRVEAFCWLAMASKISITDNLRTRGLRMDSISDMCYHSGRERESIDHLFFSL